MVGETTQGKKTGLDKIMLFRNASSSTNLNLHSGRLQSSGSGFVHHKTKKEVNIQKDCVQDEQN